jgi:hypothetical protein
MKSGDRWRRIVGELRRRLRRQATAIRALRNGGRERSRSRTQSHPPPPPSQLVSPPLQSAVSVPWQDESEFTSLQIMGVQESLP